MNDQEIQSIQQWVNEHHPISQRCAQQLLDEIKKLRSGLSLDLTNDRLLWNSECPDRRIPEDCL